MNLEELFEQQLKIVEASGNAKSAAPDDFEFPTNPTPLQVDRPFYLENAIFSTAQDYDLKELKEKKQAHKPEDIIEKAHPKSVWVSDALGDGGLVENQNEQQAKIVQMINKLPTGNLINNYAEMINTLVKIAAELELEDPDVAAEVDRVLVGLADALNGQQAPTPSPALAGREVDRQSIAGLNQPELKKEGFAWLLGAAILAGVAGLGAGVWGGLGGIQQRLDKDTSDLVKIIETAIRDPQNLDAQAELNQLLADANQLNSISTDLMTASADVIASSDETSAQQLNQLDQQFGQLLGRVLLDVNGLEGDVGGVWLARVNNYLEDIQASYRNLHINANHIANQATTARQKSVLPGVDEAKQMMAQPVPAPAKSPAPSKPPAVPDPNRIKQVQQYLSQNGFGPLQLTGKPDQATKRQLVDFENYINRTEKMENGEYKTGLGLSNLPGNRLASLLDTTLTSDHLHALLEMWKNPSAAMGTL